MRAAGQLRPFELELRTFFADREVDLDAQAIVFNLFRTQTDVFSAIEAAALRPLGLTHAGFVLLMSVWTMGPLEPRRLASVLGVSKPAVVSAVNTLEARGYVRRVKSVDDRRLVTVELTPAGRRLVEKAQRGTHRWERVLTSGFSRDEQLQFASFLRRLAEAARSPDCVDNRYEERGARR
jgi:DNA-binding MarR family transcriptional regulator